MADQIPSPAKITTIIAGMRSTWSNIDKLRGNVWDDELEARVRKATLDIDRLIQRAEQAAIAAQVRYLEDPDNDCTDLIDTAEAARSAARTIAADLRQSIPKRTRPSPPEIPGSQQIGCT